MPLSVKIGAVVGILAFLLSAIPGLQLFLGGCFFEETCEEYQGMAIPFALVVASVVGISAGLVTGCLVHLVGVHSPRR